MLAPPRLLASVLVTSLVNHFGKILKRLEQEGAWKLDMCWTNFLLCQFYSNKVAPFKLLSHHLAEYWANIKTWLIISSPYLLTEFTIVGIHLTRDNDHVVFCVQAENCIYKLLQLVGPTDLREAKSSHQFSLRASFASQPEFFYGTSKFFIKIF